MSDPVTLLQAGLEQGHHLGAQLHVLQRGRVALEFICGDARPGIPLRADSLTQWFSSGKPLTAIAIAQLYEAGELQLEDHVSRYLPEFATAHKESITLWHLLTHTAGFRSADHLPRHLDWPEAIRLICEAPLEPGWSPGEKAGYSTQAAWFILAEIIQRITRTPFPEYIRRELLEPLGMTDTWLSLPLDQTARYGDRIAQMFDTLGRQPPNLGGAPSLAPLQDPSGMALCRPGATARGPIAQLARFYQMLLQGGTFAGRRYLAPETIDLFTRRHRTGLFDHTFGHILDYGLGFLLNSNRYGPATVPYGYGRLASENAYGHSGAQSSCAFADPRHELVVAWVTNGMPGERTHQTRQRELNTAIYQHLGLLL